MSRSRDWRVFAVAAFAAIAFALMAACAEPTASAPESGPRRDLTVVGGGLLSCPTSSAQSASAVIGPEGGTVAVGRSSITIPTGAVPVATRFKMVVPSSRYVEVNITADDGDHYRFQAPVTVVIDYSRCGLLATLQSTLGVWYVEDSTRALLEVMPARNDPIARTLTFPTDHLSSYAVAY